MFQCLFLLLCGEGGGAARRDANEIFAAKRFERKARLKNSMEEISWAHFKTRMRAFDGHVHQPFDLASPPSVHVHAGIEPSSAYNIFFRGPNAVTPSSSRSSSPISRKASISTSALVNVSV